MPKLNPYLENKKPIELVQEIKDEYKVPSYEEFVKSYENDEEINESYDFEVASYGGIGEPKGSGPMFNFFQLLQVLVNTPAGPVVETVGRAASSPDISRAVVETGRFIEEHSNEISQIGRSFAVGNSSSSYSAFTAASSYSSDFRTLWDWWANGITGEERSALLEWGFSDRGSTYTLRELKEIVRFREWAREEWPYTSSNITTYSEYLEFRRLYWKDYERHAYEWLPDSSKSYIAEWKEKNPWFKGENSRGVVNVSKTESPVWKGLTHYRDGIKTNGKSGPKRCYYTWDGFHNEIEMYDHLGNPVDAIDPITGNRLFNPS